LFFKKKDVLKRAKVMSSLRHISKDIDLFDRDIIETKDKISKVNYM